MHCSHTFSRMLVDKFNVSYIGIFVIILKVKDLDQVSL